MRPLTFRQGNMGFKRQGRGLLPGGLVARNEQRCEERCREDQLCNVVFHRVSFTASISVCSLSVAIRPGAHFAVTFKSSKYVTESAFVQRPTLPAFLKVSSVASIFLLPS